MSGLRVGTAQSRLLAWRQWWDPSVQPTYPICPSCYANLQRRRQTRGTHSEARRSITPTTREAGTTQSANNHKSKLNKDPQLSPTPLRHRIGPESFTTRRMHFKPTPSALALPESLIAHDNPVQEHSKEFDLQSANDQTTISISEADLVKALRSEDSRGILDILENAYAEQNHEFLQNLPGATWSDIIRVFHPRNNSSSFHRMHRSLNPNAMRNIGLAHSRQQERFSTLIEDLTNSMRDFAGISLTLADYRQLLSFAAFRGNLTLARSIWYNMKEDGLLPDMKCYNHLMEAILYEEESRLQQKRLGKGWMQNLDLPQHTRITLYNTNGMEEINELFLEMASQGIRGDTQTMCLVLTAMGRLGDLEGAASLLMQAWGIDVPSVEAGEEAPVKSIARSPTSPLYPNSKLLDTIAEIYGMNDRISLALRLVDLTSRRFGIEVRKNIWHRLLHWLWMYARRDLEEDPAGGSRKLDDVQMLASMMLGQKGTPRQSLEMCHILFKASYDQDRWNQATVLTPMIAGRLLYAEATKNYRKAARNLTVPQASSHLSHQSQTTLARQVRDLRITVRQHAAYLRRWATNCVRRRTPWQWQTDPETLSKAEEWWYRGLQDFLTEWSDWVPSTLKYSTTTGLIELSLESPTTAVGQRDYIALNRREELWLGKRRSAARSPASGIETSTRRTRQDQPKSSSDTANLDSVQITHSQT